MDFSDPAYVAATSAARSYSTGELKAKYPTRLYDKCPEIKGYFLRAPTLVRAQHFLGRGVPPFYCSSCTDESPQGDLCPVVQKEKDRLRAEGKSEKELYMAQAQRIHLFPFYVDEVSKTGKKGEQQTYRKFVTALSLRERQVKIELQPEAEKLGNRCLSCGAKEIFRVKWVAPDGNEVPWSEEDRRKGWLPVNKLGDGKRCIPTEVIACRKCKDPKRTTIYDTRVTIRWVGERAPFSYDFEFPIDPPTDEILSIEQADLASLAPLEDPAMKARPPAIADDTGPVALTDAEIPF